ncbi:NAD(P)-binding protein [Xylaria sp. FL1777]|nr:NAD(P)-binding protein [Xylaria sp. FL1777]
MSSPVALILGVGARTGVFIADGFVADGYKVAIASRKGTGSKNEKGILSLKADFSDPKSIPVLFDAVKAEFKTVPSVVVYHAAAVTPPPDKDSVLSITTESVASDFNVNTISPYTAAQQAIAGWETLPEGTKKTFIFTGSILNTVILPVPLMQNLGMGKSATAYWIGLADTLYAAKGYRFFYADERYEDGKAKAAKLDGPAHAEFYTQLAKQEGKVPWHATFVKGQGYAQFK